MKKCNKCNLEKNLELFSKCSNRKDGLKATCKNCDKKINEKYRKINTKKYIYKNHNKYHNDYYHKNKEKINKERVEKRNKSTILKLQHNCRCRIAKIISRKKIVKNSSTSEMIGCSYEELIIHLESKFTEGMSWENYGKWHVDHIIPISIGKTIDEIKKLSNYKNLQPLWAEENIKKRDKV